MQRAAGGAYRIETVPAQRRHRPARAAGAAAGRQGLLDRPDEPRPAVHPRVRQGRVPRALPRRPRPPSSPRASSEARSRRAPGTDKLVAAPFWANTQLLWYRKSRGRGGRARPASEPVTWDQLIEARRAAGHDRRGPGQPLRGLHGAGSAPWSTSAGGQILENPEAGRRTSSRRSTPTPAARRRPGHPADSATSGPPTRRCPPPTRRRARRRLPGRPRRVHGELAVRLRRRAGGGGGRHPRPGRRSTTSAGPATRGSTTGTASRPPLGGIDLGIGAFSEHQDHALEAVAASPRVESQTEYMLTAKNPARRAAVYDDPEVREAFPMADVIRESIAAAAPGPQTPYYTECQHGAAARASTRRRRWTPTDTPARPPSSSSTSSTARCCCDRTATTPAPASTQPPAPAGSPTAPGPSGGSAGCSSARRSS